MNPTSDHAIIGTARAMVACYGDDAARHAVQRAQALMAAGERLLDPEDAQRVEQLAEVAVVEVELAVLRDRERDPDARADVRLRVDALLLERGI